MHTPETATVKTVDIGDNEPHRTLSLSAAWSHHDAIDVSGWASIPTPERTAEFPNLVGRATLSLRTGPFFLDLKPTAAELRALAELRNILADDLPKAVLQ